MTKLIFFLVESKGDINEKKKNYKKYIDSSYYDN